MSEEEGSVVLTYKDHTLYESDLSLLGPRQWLNDRLIGFYYDFLEDLSTHIRLVNPDTAMLIQHLSKEDVAEDMQSLELGAAEFILLPINNNNDVNRAGGSHWSLLAWVKNVQKFFMFDSSNGMNNAHADSIAAKLAALVVDPENGNWNPAQNTVIANTPKQPNGFDCGMYVIAISEAFISHVKMTKTFSVTVFENYLATIVTQNAVTQKRKEILNLIAKLAIGQK
jgi:sentrin-specific protease 8